MLISAPDTPFGKAFAQFIWLFTRPPLNRAELNAAFDSLAALAERDHPEKPWPLLFNHGSERAFPVTVEGMLAHMRARYMQNEELEEQDVLSRLAILVGTKVAVKLQASTNLSVAVHFTMPNGYMNSLFGECPWQLEYQELLCTWESPKSLVKKAVATTKKAKVDAIGLGSAGELVLGLSTGANLKLLPDTSIPNDLAIRPDYTFHFHLPNQSYYRFGGLFLADLSKPADNGWSSSFSD